MRTSPRPVPTLFRGFERKTAGRDGGGGVGNCIKRVGVNKSSDWNTITFRFMLVSTNVIYEATERVEADVLLAALYPSDRSKGRRLKGPTPFSSRPSPIVPLMTSKTIFGRPGGVCGRPPEEGGGGSNEPNQGSCFRLKLKYDTLLLRNSLALLLDDDRGARGDVGWAFKRTPLARSPLGVPFHVQRQVIGPAEATFAVTALERFGAGVFAVVPGELVAARETPFASLPRAFVWFFTWNQRKSIR
ncbi:hypothetical protein GWI33_016928 [Rhynchophorus ferrugineus]|uniref:Uncharacterized protein n=1 Tax=Rhynchophorus ferrugineus TaxID=354439 RepID=A0A834I2T4_RHYFE|nr:hypothetical protein GWI33_016928 [Rhynchophorus ferrugineus]